MKGIMLDRKSYNDGVQEVMTHNNISSIPLLYNNEVECRASTSNNSLRFVIQCLYHRHSMSIIAVSSPLWRMCNANSRASSVNKIFPIHVFTIITYINQFLSRPYPFLDSPSSGLRTPCIGLQIPLTLSFRLLTTLPPFTRRFLAAFPLSNNCAFCRTCSLERFLTQIALVTVLAEEERIGGENVEGEVGVGAM